jgi:DNA-binding NtrC family response regulator
MARFLMRWDFPVLMASDGGEAIDLFRERDNEILGILLGLKMPGIDGHGAYTKIREISPDVPVILTSGYSEAESTIAFDEHDLAGFLQKPFKAAILREIVCKAFNQST